MALNTCKMWSNDIKLAFFSKKLRKIARWLGASPPDPHNLWRLGAPPPDPRLWYVWITVHLFTQTRLSIWTCSHFSYWFRSCPWTSSKLRAYTRPQLLIFHSTISLLPQKIPLLKLWWCHCMWFVVWDPPIKNHGYAYGKCPLKKLPPLPFCCSGTPGQDHFKLRDIKAPKSFTVADEHKIWLSTMKYCLLILYLGLVAKFWNVVGARDN